jgi:ABC-2 type transport system ATP-binding protein
MNEVVIEVEDFHKAYGKATAVNGIFFQVHPGAIFGLRGLNRAGKTTTLECQEGLGRPGGGSLPILGEDPCQQLSRLKDLIGEHFQITPSLYGLMTAIMLPLVSASPNA